ncbi:MAG TPA: class I SAM-dependent methyltransferase [Candidatus Polarisedimenticolia bacterium]|jgi:ubiquinone/menaquinone biosynthesis C-methylase UbiE
MERYTYEILYRTEESHWWFAGRRRLILDQIARCCEGRRDLRSLDLGCGTGIFLESLARYGEPVGLDVSEDALAFCRERRLTRLVRADGSLIPFADESFDLLTANDLIEHLEDDAAALSEFRRVLKPGGRAIVFVPAFGFLWSLQDEISHHRRRYTVPRLARAIGEAGLEVERITYANTLLFPVIFAGRQALKVMRRFREVRTENDLHPGWSNGILKTIFGWEAPLLRRMDLPFGVSILAVCRKGRR